MRKNITEYKDIPDIVKSKGYRMDYFYRWVGISATHFHFVKKGERVLAKDKKDAINDFLGTNLK